MLGSDAEVATSFICVSALLEERLNEPRPGGKNVFLIGALCSGALRRLEETKLKTSLQLERIFLRLLSGWGCRLDKD